MIHSTTKSICGPIALLLFWVTLEGPIIENSNRVSAFEAFPSSRWILKPRGKVSKCTFEYLSSIPTLKLRTAYSNRQSLSPNSVLLHGSSSNNNNNDDSAIDDDDDEIFTPSVQPKDETAGVSASANKNDFLDDLTPPPVNFARNSILFSENPSTKVRNNPPLEVWKFCRTSLPAVITGAWPWRDIETLDERPLAALYNALLVRLPVLAVAVSYLYQKIAQNHDLVIDLGFDSNGPQAVPPVLVISVLVLILL